LNWICYGWFVLAILDQMTSRGQGHDRTNYGI